MRLDLDVRARRSHAVTTAWSRGNGKSDGVWYPTTAISALVKHRDVEFLPEPVAFVLLVQRSSSKHSKRVTLRARVTRTYLASHPSLFCTSNNSLLTEHTSYPGQLFGASDIRMRDVLACSALYAFFPDWKKQGMECQP